MGIWRAGLDRQVMGEQKIPLATVAGTQKTDEQEISFAAIVRTLKTGK